MKKCSMSCTEWISIRITHRFLYQVSVDHRKLTKQVSHTLLVRDYYEVLSYVMKYLQILAVIKPCIC